MTMMTYDAAPRRARLPIVSLQPVIALLARLKPQGKRPFHLTRQMARDMGLPEAARETPLIRHPML